MFLNILFRSLNRWTSSTWKINSRPRTDPCWTPKPHLRTNKSVISFFIFFTFFQKNGGNERTDQIYATGLFMVSQIYLQLFEFYQLSTAYPYLYFFDHGIENF